MIRVLHVVTLLNRGGLETMLMNYYRAMDRTRVQFDFLVHREARGDYEDEIEALGGRIYRLPPITPSSMPGYNRRMKQFLAAHGPIEIIHSHLDTLSGLPLLAAMEMGVPVRIAHCHTTAVARDWKAPVRGFLKRGAATYASHYFACSEPAGRWFYGRKLQDRVRVLNNAIPVTDYAYKAETAEAVRKELGLRGKWVAGHVGSFTPPKNHIFLLNVFSEIRRTNEDARLLLIGDGELRSGIEGTINRLGLSDSVLLLGVRPDVPRLLQAVDIFLFPSLYEGLPVALIEAQASGLPCLVSDRVPEEAAVSGRVEFLSLEAGPRRWAERAAEFPRGFERRNMCREIIAAGYDIESSARELQVFYLAFCNG
jgi:glycosyltransferase involved in cell wall biosynthesis